MFMENTPTAQYVARYGYLAVLAGTMLEGESIVLVAGFFAHQGYLKIPFIILCAVIGSSISDQGLFFLARLRGVKFLCRFPRTLAKIQGLADKARARPVMLTSFALLFRFFYGVRNVAALFLGVSTIPTLRFVVLNALGAIIWATVFSCGGYFFASALSAVMGKLAHYEIALAVLLALGGIGFGYWRKYHSADEPSPVAEKNATGCPPSGKKQKSDTGSNRQDQN